MKFINKLEKKFSSWAIGNITLYLILGQVAVFMFSYSGVIDLERMVLAGNKVLAGEFWRILTFPFIPITREPLFAAFVWYLYYLFGTALENRWGVFRYNLFLLIGFLATIVSAFVFPEYPLTNTYIYTSVFLAFAHLHPDFVLYIFFILPVKARWLAWLTWAGLIFNFIFGAISSKMLIIISISNFLLFFGKDIFLQARYGFKGMGNQLKDFKDEEKPFHKCSVCGKTDKSHPDLEFRYCTECKPVKCFCEKCLKEDKH